MYQVHLNAIFIWCTLLVEACEIVSSFTGQLLSHLLNWELDMGEIDTKPIEPVQVGITLFDDKSDQRLHRPSPSNRAAHEMEIEQLQKELASYKVQLQAKDVAYSQLLHKLEHHRKTEQELSNQLNNTKIERDVYFEEYKEAQHRIDELDAQTKDMNHQLSEFGKTRHQLSHVLLELKTIQNEFLCLQTEFAAAQDETGKKLETIRELENQLILKKSLIDSLQLELNRANELLSSSDKAVSDAINDLGKLKSDLEEKEKENSDQAVHITVLEVEIVQLKLELNNANDEISRLNCELKTVTEELEKAKTNEDEAKERVAITMEEYRGLTEKARETEKTKKEMEAVNAKVAEFRTRAEQARARAEAAERAKMGLEEQLKKLREQKQRRKAALAALREESLSREFGSSSSSYDAATRDFQPLGKILNMKF